MSLFRVSWWVSQLVFTMAAWIEANISVHLQRQKRIGSMHVITSSNDNILFVLTFLYPINWLKMLVLGFYLRWSITEKLQYKIKFQEKTKTREKFSEFSFTTYFVVRKRTSSLSLVQWDICIPSSMQMTGGGSTTSLLVIG